MENKYKIVDFKTWCPKCKYHSYPEAADPCNDCLNMGANEQTNTPVLFEERSNSGGKARTQTANRE